MNGTSTGLVVNQAASRSICLARGEYSGAYLPIPADLQQVLLQDLLPKVVQISTAVLGLPGRGAYTGFGGSSTNTSSVGTLPVDEHPLPDSAKCAVAVCLVQCVCFAAHSEGPETQDNSGLSVQAAALGSHILAIGQLFEAAARRAAAGLGRVNLQALCRFLGALCCVTSAGPGAFKAPGWQLLLMQRRQRQHALCRTRQGAACRLLLQHAQGWLCHRD
jgi:hypothetical protein